MILLDTNILIEYFKANSEVVPELKSIGYDNLATSSITQMELYFGARDKIELTKIKKALSSLTLFHITSLQSELAVNLIERYAKSHSLSVPDALIAAIAISQSLQLYTLNLKDFQYIDGLQLYKTKL